MKYQYQHFNLFYNTLNELDIQLNNLGEKGWNLEILKKYNSNHKDYQWDAVVFGKRKNPINKRIDK